MPRNKIFYGWVIVVSCLLINSILLGGRLSFGVFLKPLETEFGVGRAAVSSIYSVYMVLCAFLALVTGWVVDRFGPRRIFVALGLITGASLILTSQTDKLWQLYFSFSVLMAFGTGGSMVVAMATFSPWFRKKRGIALGIMSSSAGLGAVVLAPLVAYIITTAGWRNAYLVLGLLTLAIVVSLSFLLRGSPREMGLFPDGERPAEIPASPSSEEAGHGARGLTLAEAWKTGQLKLLMALFLIFSFCLNLVTTHVVPYASDRGLDTLEAATILSAISIWGTVGRLIIGRISDSFGKRLPGIASVILLGVSVLWLIWCDNLWKFYLFSIFFGLAWGGYGLIILRLVPDLFEGRKLGTIMGLMDMNFMIGGAVGPALAGYIFDTTSSYNAAFIVSVILSAIAGAALISLFRTTRENDARYHGTSSSFR